MFPLLGARQCPSHSFRVKEKRTRKVRRQRKLYLHQLRKGRHICSKSRESPHQKMRGQLMWIGWVSGSMLLQGTSVMILITALKAFSHFLGVPVVSFPPE
eukprot:1017984-Pelagomonas_calceolata.AAC.1